MTERRASLPVPVWFMEGRYDPDLVFVDIDVPVVSGKDAPIVAEWGQERVRMASRHPYRRHADALWMPLLGNRSTSPAHMEEWAKAAVADGFPNSDVVQLAFDGNIQHINPVNKSFAMDVKHERPSSEAAAKALAGAPNLEHRLAVIDGNVWVRTDGPLLRIKWHSENLRYPRFEIGRGDGGDRIIDRSCLTLSALDMDASVDALTRVYGEVSIEGDRPVVVGALPSLDRTISIAAERTLWHFLWEARALPTDGNRHVVALLIEARDVLARRWPDLELDFHARLHQDAGAHLVGREVPPPDDLRHLLGRIVSDCRDVFTPSQIMNWSLAVERIDGMQARRGLDVLARLEV